MVWNICLSKNTYIIYIYIYVWYMYAIWFWCFCNMLEFQHETWNNYQPSPNTKTYVFRCHNRFGQLGPAWLPGSALLVHLMWIMSPDVVGWQVSGRFHAFQIRGKSTSSLVGGWVPQPIWKIFVKMGIFPKLGTQNFWKPPPSSPFWECRPKNL